VSAGVDPLRGIYLHGDVGCGKSFVMDLFYESIPLEKKERVHFHAFMRDVHRRTLSVHELVCVCVFLHFFSFFCVIPSLLRRSIALFRELHRSMPSATQNKCSVSLPLLPAWSGMHVWRTQERAEHEHDPIPPLAKLLADRARLLCFDEFQVSDVGDAAILHRLFRALIVDHNVLVVSTSNRPPEGVV
jgi:predicted ATPase